MDIDSFKNVVTTWLCDDPADFWMSYYIGSELWGETNAKFRSDGSYLLWSTVTKDRKRREFSGEVEATEVRELLSLIAAERLWGVQHVHQFQSDDDSLAVLEVAGAGQHGRVELWLSEMESVPAFRRFQRALLEFASRLSAGAILETGQ